MTDSKEPIPPPASETTQTSTPVRHGPFRALLWAATHLEEVVTALDNIWTKQLREKIQSYK